MFREIRTSERITDNTVTTNNMHLMMALLDRRISDNTREEMKKIRKEERKESRFDPDKRI